MRRIAVLSLLLLSSPLLALNYSLRGDITLTDVVIVNSLSGATPIFTLATLAPGARLPGPAIIAEDETSTLIGIGWTASINGLGYIELVRETA